MPDERQTLRIGEWRVDPILGELSRGEQLIRIEPRTMRLLLYLAEHAGQLVEVRQLLDEVWPDVVVTQGSVYQAVAELRRVLGDDKDHPTYIENVPRRGYRLIASVAPLGISPVTAPDSPPPQPPVPGGAPRPRVGPAAIALTVATIALLAGVVWWRASRARTWSTPAAARTEATVTPAVIAPPPHSIAVLPFVNISGDASQDYFADGLTEELLNSLSRIDGLQVAARVSSFSFRGEHPDIATVARRLNVGSVLEGSMRRMGHKVRITAQLDNAVTGFRI
jgi:transcriptional activator of cad operon